MRAFRRQIVVVLALAVAALATMTSAASAQLPQKWDSRTVAVNRDPDNTFLLRPGQILAAPGDATDVARVLKGWKPLEQRPYGITVFTRPTQNPADPAREVMDALATIRRATANRPQGPAQVSPNHVFVGEATTSAAAINFTGEPRIQGGPGSSVRQAAMPAALPMRTTRADDGSGVKIAVLDTGMFEHEWLDRRPARSRQRRRLGRGERRVRRQRGRPRHVHRRPDPAGGARRVGLRRQGARLARRR